MSNSIVQLLAESSLLVKEAAFHNFNVTHLRTLKIYKDTTTIDVYN